MSEQIDIAVDLGVVAAPLQEILTLRRLVEIATAPPRQIIEGMFEQQSNEIDKAFAAFNAYPSLGRSGPWWLKMASEGMMRRMHVGIWRRPRRGR